MQAVPPTRLLRPGMHLISDSERGSAAADIGVKSIRHQLKARLHSAAGCTTGWRKRFKCSNK